MLSDIERRLARIAVQKRYLTNTQLCACVENKRLTSAPLERILVEQGFLTPEELNELVRMSSEAPPPAPPFGQILKETGLASDTQIREATSVKEQLAAQNIHRYLGEILVERKVISSEQVEATLAQQGKQVVECHACGYRFNAVHGEGFACPECGAPINPTGAPPAPSLPYTLREEIGRGPSGTVQRAFDEKLHQEVSLKVLNPGRHPSELTRRAAALAHPNIARTLAITSWSGAPAIVREFVEGIPLYDHVVGNVRLLPEDAIPILKQIAAALGWAHSRGIAHGDLKARNVLVTESREVKVTDFGFAPALGEAIPADLLLYSAPERLRGGPSVPSDLYACGVLWYFMLSGGQPFAAPSATEIRRKHAEGKCVPLAGRVPELPRGCGAIFTKLCFKEPSLRYRGAEALLADLDRLENGETTLAERELGHRTTRRIRRP